MTNNFANQKRNIDRMSRLPLDLTGATIAAGRAFAINAEDVIIEIDEPHSQIVTWRGNHATEDAAHPQKGQ